MFGFIIPLKSNIMMKTAVVGARNGRSDNDRVLEERNFP